MAYCQFLSGLCDRTQRSSSRLFDGIVVIAFIEGVAAADSFEAEPGAFQDAVFLDGLDGVGGAGRIKAAVGAEHW